MAARTFRLLKDTGIFQSIRLLLFALFAITLWLLFLAYQIYSYASVTGEEPADAAIVLGAAIWRDQPSPIFRERINHAIDLYQSGQVKILILTGGTGEGKQFSESEVAKGYAIQRGVPAEKILIENISRTTYENLVEASKIVAEQGFQHLLIVSDPLHMKRAMAIAQGLGLNAQPSPTPTTRFRTKRTKLGFLSREVFFYAGYLLKIYR